MAYTPKTWECGETITADALNHIEQGIASSGGGTEPLVVHTNGVALDHTWQEIFDAYPNVALDESNAGFFLKMSITEVRGSNGAYSVYVDEASYSTNSEDGYPRYDEA